MSNSAHLIIVGSGSAALCAGIAALERGCGATVIEKAQADLAGGNSRYTAGAMRFCYDGAADLLPLLADPDDPQLALTDFGTYAFDDFAADLARFNGVRPLSTEQMCLITESYQAVSWLAGKGIRFFPSYAHQSSQIDGRHKFWGGLAIQAEGEGPGLVDAEFAIFEKLGGRIVYGCSAKSLLMMDGRVVGVSTSMGDRLADAVILACGGFEADPAMRADHLGEDWRHAKVRGSPHNTGDGLIMAVGAGARQHGSFQGCHASPVDFHAPDFGNLEIAHSKRKLYRKIWYHLGIMINDAGLRFVDEGSDLRNYTYAQIGRSILGQPNRRAWQIFDASAVALLPQDYHFEDAHFIEAASLDTLTEKLGAWVDPVQLRATVEDFNMSIVRASVQPFDLSVKDGNRTEGLTIPKSNWARPLTQGPFRAYPVTGGITFTYGGVEVDAEGAVVAEAGDAIPGLFACGEMVGGVFFNGYPGGAGLTSGVVFGLRAGAGAARFATGGD